MLACSLTSAQVLWILTSVTTPVSDSLYFLKLQQEIDLSGGLLPLDALAVTATLKIGAWGYCFDSSETDKTCSRRHVGWTIGALTNWTRRCAQPKPFPAATMAEELGPKMKTWPTCLVWKTSGRSSSQQPQCDPTVLTMRTGPKHGAPADPFRCRPWS